MFRVILFQISACALLCKTAHFVLLLLHELGSEPLLHNGHGHWSSMNPVEAHVMLLLIVFMSGSRAKRHYHLRRMPGNHPAEFLWCIAFALTLSLLLLRSRVPPQPPPSFLLFFSSAMGFWLKCMHILEICMHFIFTRLCYRVSLHLLLFLLSCVTISGTLFSVLYVL